MTFATMSASAISLTSFLTTSARLPRAVLSGRIRRLHPQAESRMRPYGNSRSHPAARTGPRIARPHTIATGIVTLRATPRSPGFSTLTLPPPQILPVDETEPHSRDRSAPIASRSKAREGKRPLRPLLDLSEPTIHRKLRTGNIRGVRRRQERHRTRNFIWLTYTLHWDSAHDAVREFLHRLFRHTGSCKSFRRINRSRAHGVYADSAPNQLSSNRPCEGPQRCFGRRIHRAVDHSHFIGLRGVQDDRRAVVQKRKRLLNREIRPLGVDIKQLVIQPCRSYVERGKFVDPRVNE